MPTPTTSYPLLRGGQRLPIVKLPDEFTVRTAPAVNERTLSQAFGCELQERLPQQQLSVLSVPGEGRDQAMAGLRGSPGVAFASHVYTLQNDPFGRIYLTDELTLEFKPDLAQAAIEALMEEQGLSYVRKLPGLEHAYIFRLNASARANPLKLAYELDQLEEVRSCEANVAFKSLHFYTPSDSLFSEQWHLHHMGGVHLEQGSHVDITRAWDITRGSRSIVVAVADDSVDLNHRDFKGPGKVVAPRDFQGRDFNPAPELEFDNHGTACAGVAVAEENGSGVVGAAPACALMPIRTSGIIDDNSIEALFDWAVDNGASVISNSWGACCINYPLSNRQRLAVERAAKEGRNGKGIVVCFAAGNANRPVSGLVMEKKWPGREPDGATFWYNGYAVLPYVIAVSACTSLNKKSAYSNWGKEISVCAPSNNGHPSFGEDYTYPRIRSAFPGREIYTTDRVGQAGYDSSDYTAHFGGTSSVCPLVAGIAALMLSANPELTAAEVKAILESTADKIVDTGTGLQLGNAFGAYDENGHSQWFGYGKVNAFAAVAEARRRLIGVGAPQSFSGSSSPALPIPDNVYQGVEDVIQVAKQGALQGLELIVRISHTYIGDLKVSLIAPSGKAALLHNKQGGGKNNLNRTYTLEDTPALSGLAGEFVEGNWRLLVQDIAPRDTGRLESWSLSMLFLPSRLIQLEEQPGIVIPDDEPEGIQRELIVAAAGKVKKASVSVDVSHTFISDLLVSLESPAGTEIVLHDRTGGGADNLATTFNTENTPALRQFAGQPARGAWRLKVKDLAYRDVGKLNAWHLQLEVE